MKKVLNFVVIGLLISGMMGASAAYHMQEYYPLMMGNSWTYFESGIDIENNQTEVWSEAAETMIVSANSELINGVETRRIIHTSFDPKYDDYENLAWDQEGLKLYYSYDLECCEEEPEVEEGRFITPMILLPAQMEIGKPKSYPLAFQSYEGGQLTSDVEGSLTATLEGLETITVEAGTFKDCLKVHRRLQMTFSEPQGGTVQGHDNYEDYIWLAHGVGLIKANSILNWSDADGNTGKEEDNQELRWAQVNGVQYGSGVQLWNGFDTSHALAWFQESSMYMRRILNDNQEYWASFELDFENLFYAYQLQWATPVSVPGLDFTLAYIKMNGDQLTIYNVKYHGVNYLTQWKLLESPRLGFSFEKIALME